MTAHGALGHLLTVSRTRPAHGKVGAVGCLGSGAGLRSSAPSTPSGDIRMGDTSHLLMPGVESVS
ncbi:MAG: hypothetical protein WCH60_00400 [Burkholderiales bacterium]